MNCLDTYALVEIYKGNPAFNQVLNEPFLIADVTLAEFYSVLLREFGQQTADFWLKKYAFYCQTIDLETFIDAVKFRQENKKSGISFFDAVGYVYSLKHNYYFVTGDKEFRGFKSVKFIK